MILRASRVLALIACISPSLSADDWWVASGGTGSGSAVDPFGLVQQGIDAAAPGDIVRVVPGTYTESLVTSRHGTPATPIVLQAEPGGDVVITSPGRVLDIQHAHFTIEGVIFDGQYGASDTVRVRDGGDFLTLRDCEVRRSSRDCIDMGAPEGVVLDGCRVHRCLDPTDGRTDAHGVVGGAVRDLLIIDTEIHTFSGDAVQLDPGRQSPGWDDVTIHGCHFWLAPLDQAENGFAAGTVPGENAVDTKTWNDAPFRARLTIRDSVAHGFRDSITNMAAFNLKEKIDAVVDRVTVYDSEIAFRLRGPTSSRPAGAWVEVRNAVVHTVDKAVRYEDDIENLRIYNTTLGLDVVQSFQAASSAASVLEVRNLLLLGDSLPPQAVGPSNLAVYEDSFVDAAGGDYRLDPMSPAVEVGDSILEVAVDRRGLPRPQGNAYEIGAYELCPECVFMGDFESGSDWAWSSAAP